jgi:hypothetical protein
MTTWFSQMETADLPQDVLEGLEQFLSEQEPEAYIAFCHGRSTPEQRETLALKAGHLLEDYRQEFEEEPILGIVVTRRS